MKDLDLTFSSETWCNNKTAPDEFMKDCNKALALIKKSQELREKLEKELFALCGADYDTDIIYVSDKYFPESPYMQGLFGKVRLSRCIPYGYAFRVHFEGDNTVELVKAEYVTK